MFNKKEYMSIYRLLPHVQKAKKTWRRNNRHQTRIRQNAANFWCKLWVLTILGGKCELCGCSNPLMLTLDHRLGDSAAHRRKVGGNSQTMYRIVLKAGCPTTRYRVLCGSCNLAVSNYGEVVIKRSLL
jgi:hypothetical protein